MPSTLRARTHVLVTLGFLLAMPSSLDAQELSAQAATAVTVRVRPSIAIASVTWRADRRESDGGLTATSVVNVESNLPYRLAVRLAPTPGTDPRDGAARVLVRGTSGAFESLVPGAIVTTAVSRAPGRRGHEVVCRIEPSASEPRGQRPDAVSCALVYELSAEHHDALLRTTISLLLPLPLTRHAPGWVAPAAADAGMGR